MDEQYRDFIDDSFGGVNEARSEYVIKLKARILDFAVNTIKFLSKIPDNKEYSVIKFQLSKSATSIGANFEEAQSSANKEFIYKLRISLREANESFYWYKIIDKLSLGLENHRNELKSESKEIALILGSIVSKLDLKIKKNKG